ncbi:hypothetical protein [Streptomyces sp. NPDC058457]|uniref:hypothetical protein n=1 Tax=Streptomyces sp. NPDC058457 TaxID=3346507 RepID=UPI0036546F09
MVLRAGRTGTERVRRLVARHEEFGRPHDAALARVLGTGRRNADLVRPIALTCRTR